MTEFVFWLILMILVTYVQGQLSETWAPVTKAAIAEAILNLTKLGEKYRDPQVCLKTPTVSLIPVHIIHD